MPPTDTTTDAVSKQRNQKWAWIWIAYTGFLFITPVIEPSRALWIGTLSVFFLFLGIMWLYIRYTDSGQPDPLLDDRRHLPPRPRSPSPGTRAHPASSPTPRPSFPSASSPSAASWPLQGGHACGRLRRRLSSSTRARTPSTSAGPTPTSPSSSRSSSAAATSSSLSRSAPTACSAPRRKKT